MVFFVIELFIYLSTPRERWLQFFLIFFFCFASSLRTIKRNKHAANDAVFKCRVVYGPVDVLVEIVSMQQRGLRLYWKVRTFSNANLFIILCGLKNIVLYKVTTRLSRSALQNQCTLPSINGAWTSRRDVRITNKNSELYKKTL